MRIDKFLKLVRIDVELRQFEAMRPTLGFLEYLHEKGLPDPWTNEEHEAARRSEHELLQELIELSSDIDDEAKLVLYRRGGKHTRRVLAGYMNQHPRDVFVPTMIEAIEMDEDYAYAFVLKLPKMIGRDSVPVLLKALKSKHLNTRSNALCALCDLQDVTLLPYIINLINDPHPTIQEVARKCREELEALKGQ